MRGTVLLQKGEGSESQKNKAVVCPNGYIQNMLGLNENFVPPKNVTFVGEKNLREVSQMFVNSKNIANIFISCLGKSENFAQILFQD